MSRKRQEFLGALAAFRLKAPGIDDPNARNNGLIDDWTASGKLPAPDCRRFTNQAGVLGAAAPVAHTDHGWPLRGAGQISEGRTIDPSSDEGLKIRARHNDLSLTEEDRARLEGLKIAAQNGACTADM